MLKKPRQRVPLEKKTAQQLIKVVDEAFSKYVRLRDSIYTGKEWYGQCITCSRQGSVAWVDETDKVRYSPGWDAGHFISRGEKVLRFDEENVNLQCSYRCNRMRSGEHEKYKQALNDKYGEGTYQKLEKTAHDTTYYKLGKPELLQILHDAKTAVAYYEQNH